MKPTSSSSRCSPIARHERAVRVAQAAVLLLTLLLGALAPTRSLVLPPRTIAEGA